MRISTLVLWLLAFTCFAQADPASEAPGERGPARNVRVEVLMIAAPQGKVLNLLPDLRNPQKIDAAVGKLLAAVQRKEAILTGNPIVLAVEGQKGVAEAMKEQRYPVEPDPKPATPARLPDQELTTPTDIDVRNVGTSLEAEATVSPNGETILASIIAQHVSFLGWEKMEKSASSGRAFTKGAQPQFFTAKVQTNISIANGQHLLLDVHLLPKPEGYLEVFVLRAVATAIK